MLFGEIRSLYWNESVFWYRDRSRGLLMVGRQFNSYLMTCRRSRGAPEMQHQLCLYVVENVWLSAALCAWTGLGFPTGYGWETSWRPSDSHSWQKANEMTVLWVLMVLVFWQLCLWWQWMWCSTGWGTAPLNLGHTGFERDLKWRHLQHHPSGSVQTTRSLLKGKSELFALSLGDSDEEKQKSRLTPCIQRDVCPFLSLEVTSHFLSYALVGLM